MAISRTQIVDALDANLNQMYQDGTKSWGNEYQTIFNVLNSDKAVEKDSYESGFIATPVKNEGVAATYDTILPGISETYTNLTYALGYEITEEAIEDNLRTPETFNKLPQALARSGEETVEITAANVINNGYGTNGFDGVPLFSTAHPILAGGANQANRPTTEADLSISSLTAGLTAIEKLVDERGLRKPCKAQTLGIAVDNWAVARELLESEYKPYSGNNEVNVLAKKDLTYFIWHYLTDADAWFLLSDKANHQLKFFWRVRPGALRKSTDFDSTNLKHLQRFRFSCGYSHYFGTYGSSGA